MFVPEGLTESETIDIIYKAAHRSAAKYCFGYHSVEDIVQETVIACMKILSEGKFKPRGEKPLAQQLYNFLRVWARNRQSNYRRDHSCRYSNPTSQLNVNKYNIMHPLKIHSQGLTQSNLFAREPNTADILDQEETKELILSKLNVVQRKNYFKYINGVNLSPTHQQDLFNRIEEILQPAAPDEDYEEKTYS